MQIETHRKSTADPAKKGELSISFTDSINNDRNQPYANKTMSNRNFSHLDSSNEKRDERNKHLKIYDTELNIILSNTIEHSKGNTFQEKKVRLISMVRSKREIFEIVI